MSRHPDLPAGTFSSWLDALRQAQSDDNGMAVPCGECTACCTSSYFIHIKPEETEALARIPRELLFPAPGLPKGHVLLGYDENGKCPMLIENKCSIYECRPLACRAFDCRVFPATGISPDEKNKKLIAERAQRWTFSFPDKDDHLQYAAVQAAAGFLRDHANLLPDGFVPGNATQAAILAIKVHHVFKKCGEQTREAGADSREIDIAKEVMKASEKRTV